MYNTFLHSYVMCYLIGIENWEIMVACLNIWIAVISAAVTIGNSIQKMTISVENLKSSYLVFIFNVKSSHKEE